MRVSLPSWWILHTSQYRHNIDSILVSFIGTVGGVYAQEILCQHLAGVYTSDQVRIKYYTRLDHFLMVLFTCIILLLVIFLLILVYLQNHCKQQSNSSNFYNWVCARKEKTIKGHWFYLWLRKIIGCNKRARVGSSWWQS